MREIKLHEFLQNNIKEGVYKVMSDFIISRYDAIESDLHIKLKLLDDISRATSEDAEFLSLGELKKCWFNNDLRTLKSHLEKSSEFNDKCLKDSDLLAFCTIYLKNVLPKHSDDFRQEFNEKYIFPVLKKHANFFFVRVLSHIDPTLQQSSFLSELEYLKSYNQTKLANIETQKKYRFLTNTKKIESNDSIEENKISNMGHSN